MQKIIISSIINLHKGEKIYKKRERESMQPNVQPPSAVEQSLTGSFQLMASARMQTMIMHDGPTMCMEKCMDRHDLYTNERTTQPSKIKMAKDAEEKSCVTNCGAKWDEISRRTLMGLNKAEVKTSQNKAMMHSLGYL